MFEQLINLRSIRGHAFSIFIIGVIYTFLGIISAKIIFPSYVAIMSFTFTSILLIPTISALMRTEENVVAKERHFSLRILLRDHKDIIRLYLILFLGIFVAYAVIGTFSSVSVLNGDFFAQLKVAGISGDATQWGSFGSILLNNLVVLVICFVLSLAYGAGSVLFIVWNASVWGVVFGYFVHMSSSVVGVNPFIRFFVIFLPFLPHMVTEALSYILAAIMGGIISKAVHREKFMSEKFKHILEDAGLMAVAGFVLVTIAAVLEVFVFPLFL